MSRSPGRPQPCPKAAPAATITRRDFLNGVALGLGGTASLAAAATPGSELPDPALRTGLQGQTDTVNAAAHAWRDRAGGISEAPAERDDGVEDLLVVGAGLSGLCGAHLYAKHAGRPVRMLLLDALDDVGGHARRNEFIARNGQRLVGYGGSQSLDNPSLFSPAVQQVLQDIGVDWPRFNTQFFDHGWHERHGLDSRALVFDARTWGRSEVVLRQPGEAPASWLARTPLPHDAQRQLARLLAEPAADVLPRGMPPAARRDMLTRLTCRQFYQRYWQLGAQALRWLQADTEGYFGAGIDATSALDAWAAGLPGFSGLGLGSSMDTRLSPSGRLLHQGQDPYVFHFPDGNSGVARALLRQLIPEAMPGSDMISLAEGRVQHAALDRPKAPVRLRLRATAVHLRHLGPPGEAQLVEVRYLDSHGQLRVARARQVLLACWHRVVARLTDELPAAQVAALNDQVKVPLLYGTVLLNNWRAFQRAGISGLQPVDSFWREAVLDFSVRMGSLGPPEHPDQPILLHLSKVVLPAPQEPALPPREQAARGRALLTGWSFDELAQETTRLLQSGLGDFGFEAGRDIEAITINRWAHGYAYEYMRPWDRCWPQGPLPCTTARRGWGRVAIANADAGAYAYAHGAMDQAARAVQELLPQARLPSWSKRPGPV